jgi:tetratricopeptide (TPR) repeat protein
LWRDVTLKSPGNARGWTNYGAVLLGRGSSARALEAFERARALAPAYPWLELNLALARAARNEDVLAQAHFERALELDPRLAPAHYEYARFLLDRSRGPAALEHLLRAVAVAPAHRDARTMLAHFHAALGEREALEALVRGTLEIAPGDRVAEAYLRGDVPFPVPEPSAAAHAAVGFERARHERWLDAAALFRRAVELDPGSASARSALDSSLAHLGFDGDTPETPKGRMSPFPVD